VRAFAASAGRRESEVTPLSLDRFLTRLIWLCVAPLLLLAAYLAFNHVWHVHDERELEADNLAKTLAADLDHELSARIAALRTLAASPLADDPATWHGLYREAQGFTDSFGDDVVLVDLRQQVIFNTRLPFGSTLHRMPDSQGRSSVATALQTGQPAVGDIFVGPRVGEPLVAVAAPGLRDGRVRFILATVIETRRFQQRIDEMTLSDRWALELLDGTGATIARRPSQQRSGAADAPAWHRVEMKSGLSAWQLVLEIPRGVYLTPLVEAATALAIGVLAATLVGVLGGTLAGRRLARSVASLAQEPQPGAPAPAIAEVGAVRRLLDESAEKRRQAEASLALSEARLRGIFASATDAIVTIDTSQTILMANPAAERMFGCPIDQLIGAPVERLIPARYHARHRLQVQAFGEREADARPMGVQRDVVGLRSDGEEFPIDASISHLQVGGQRLFTAILRDVSDSRRAEAALRDSEARLRQLLALLPDAVFVNSGGRIAFVNEAASRLFGADESALLGRLVLELIHPDSIEPVRARVAALLGGATTVPPVELKVVRADGDVRTVESTDTRFVDHEEVSLIVVLRDVTELRQAQTALRESHADLQRLIESQNSVQEDERKRIARELHDDLQQTLASIAINVAAIGERLPPDAAAAVPVLAEVGQLATAAIESTRRIVNDLRPQILEDLGLVPALEVMADQFERHSGISCQLELDADAGDRVLAAPAVTTCLYRVAQESLNNVAKHAWASLVRIRLTGNADGSVALRITDDGQGIDAKDRRKLDSFGLLGMQERVRAVGGRLRVESRPGDGTTVEVVVPLVGAMLEA